MARSMLDDLGREKMLERIWAWKDEYQARILNQLRRMGASCDWDRERFTMDEGLSKAVRKVFVQLYDEGLIYQGDYIINWCCRCHTALSDLEVEHEDLDGHFYHIRYPFADGSGSVVVATTRPETMLGDTAVAVNPEDDRYHGIKARTVPIWLKINTGRRPCRSDRRPSQGAARNWAAKNEVDSSVICRMVPPNCPSA